MPQAAFGAVGAIVTKGIGMLAAPLVAKLGEGAAIALVTNVLKVGAYTALSVAANALFTPQVGASGSPSEWEANGQAPIPFVVGRMGLAGNIVYRKEYGGDNRYQSIVTVYSGAGPIDGWETFTADGVALNFGANGVATNGGNMAGNFWMQRRLGAQPDTALTSPAGLDGGASLPGWGSNHILSGFAASMITLRQDSKFATYPAGEPQPMQVLRGIRVYDPRQDSTYPGGSGSQRLADRTTWGYSTNPIIHGLNWSLGYRHNGKLAGGIGADFGSIDVGAFISCANVADANGWTIAGRFTSLDDKHNVLVAMLQAGGAMYAERGGRISCVTRGAPRTSIATISVADTAGPVEITSATPLRNRLNTVYPRCIQESFGWEVTQLAPIIVSDFVDADGGQREREIEYPFVTNSVQASQLAAFDIVDSREGLAGVIPLKPYMRELRPGDAFTINEPGFLLNGQKCLVLDTSYDPGSDVVRVTFRAETDQKYPFALGLDPTPPEPPALTPGSPYDAPTPDPSEWVVDGGDQEASDGSKKPVIIIGGDLDAANINAVWIEYRQTGQIEWTTWGIFHPEAVDYTITGVKPNTAYEVSVRYQNAFGVWGERIILGPFITGDDVASSSLDGQIATDALKRAAEAVDASQTDLADALENLSGVSGPGADLITSVQAGYGILEQAGGRNLIRDPLDRTGQQSWQSHQGMAGWADEDLRGGYVEMDATAADEEIALYRAQDDASVQLYPVGTRARLMLAADVAVTGVAGDPLIRVRFYDEDGDEIADSAVELDEDLGGGRIGGFVEPEDIPDPVATFGVEVAATSSGAGAQSLAVTRPFVAYAGVNQTDIPNFVEPEDETVSRVLDRAIAETDTAQTIRGVEYEASGAFSRVITVETAQAGLAQRVGVVESVQGNLQGSVQTLQQAVTDLENNTVTVTDFTQLTARVNANEGDIGGLQSSVTTLNQAVIDLDNNKASATALQQTQAELDGVSATTNVLAGAYLDNGQPLAIWGVQLGAGGVTTGLYGIANGQTSGWIFDLSSGGNVQFRSGTTGERIEISNSAMRVFDSSNTMRVRVGVW